MNHLIILPIILPLLSAALSLLVRDYPRLQRWLGVGGMAALLAVALALMALVQEEGIQVMYVGNWKAPYGITLVADLLSALLVVLAGLVGLAVVLYSLANVDEAREAYGYYPLLHILMMGISGAFLTGDMFNLYVWFEVMLIASFVLLSLGGERAQLEGAIKYVTINLVSSAIFLAALGILYGTAGTLNMADLARQLPQLPLTGIGTTLAMLFLIAFGIKAALFPLFFWLPASYHTPPAAISAIFAGLLTKVGVYTLIRVFTLLFTREAGYTHSLILLAAGLTMITGVLGALTQSDLRRLLSFLIVSHIGYMVMGLGLFSVLALAGAIFYLVHDILAKTTLFLVSGLVHRIRGSYELPELGGLYRSYPLLSILFFIPALSLAGIPPLSGFWPKLVLVQAALEQGQYLIVATTLLVSLLSLLAVSRIWAEAFWKAVPEGSVTREPPRGLLRRERLLLVTPVIGLTVIMVGVGLLAEPVFLLANQAAEQLMNPTSYIQTVLGGTQ